MLGIALSLGLVRSSLGSRGSLLVRSRLLGGSSLGGGTLRLDLLGLGRFGCLQLGIPLSLGSHRLLSSSSLGGSNLRPGFVCSSSLGRGRVNLGGVSRLHLRRLLCRSLLLQLAACCSRMITACRSRLAGVQARRLRSRLGLGSACIAARLGFSLDGIGGTRVPRGALLGLGLGFGGSLAFSTCGSLLCGGLARCSCTLSAALGLVRLGRRL